MSQVLDDGTNSYLYGNSRIGEDNGSAWAYYVADALGSVRQIADESGEVVFYQSYEPYGDVLYSTGADSDNSSYGFAGEWTDATGLQYLRARYYNTGIGRFTTRDTYEGDYQYPLTLNRWMYVNGNPILFTDPSGNECIGPGGTGPCMEYDDIPGYEGYDDYQNIPADESGPYREFVWRNYGGNFYIGCPNLFMPWGVNEIFSSNADDLVYDFLATDTGQWIYNNADDLMDLDISLLRLAQLGFRTDGYEYFVKGTHALKNSLGMVEATTHVRIDNILKLVKQTDESLFSAMGRNASAAMISPWTLVGTAIDAFQDYHDPNYNPNNNGWVKYGSAVTYDLVANAASAAVSGAAYTLGVAGVGAVMGALGVAAAPAAAAAIGIGLVGGAIAGIVTKNVIDNNYKEPIVDYVSQAAENVFNKLFGG